MLRYLKKAFRTVVQFNREYGEKIMWNAGVWTLFMFLGYLGGIIIAMVIQLFSMGLVSLFLQVDWPQHKLALCIVSGVIMVIPLTILLVWLFKNQGKERLPFSRYGGVFGVPVGFLLANVYLYFATF